MRIALFGATGALGYNFVRHLMTTGSHSVVVYATGTTNLPNLSRHRVDVRLVPYRSIANLRLDSDIDFLVNFAHPFGPREGLSSDTQLHLLGEVVVRALEASTALSVIQVSSMSVYEPFAEKRRYAEDASLGPPRRDAYARSKWMMERIVAGNRSRANRVLVVRPTVVYGPFCRPWTDNIFAAFAAGDVPYRDLSGRVQPLFVDDLSSLLLDRLERFEAGVLNLAGPEEVTWEEFLRFFERIAGGGHLVRVDDSPPAPRPSLQGEIRRAARRVVEDPGFRDLLVSSLRRLPSRFETVVRSRVVNADFRDLPRSRPQPRDGLYCDASFFGRDRLVCDRRQREALGSIALTSLQQAASTMTEYHRFRFTDAPMP